jgi:8-oxo-dGTP pyrophosphatase MutT (NUDIX family)
MTYRTGTFWQPDVTVATVVVRDGRFLLVEETVQGNLVLNQPAGHLEPDESVLEAAVRETLEETAWKVEIEAFIGAYQWKAPESGRHYLRFAFAGKALQHFTNQTLDDGIVQALWMTPAELIAQKARHRSPLVWRVMEDFLSGQRYPLSLLNHLS